MGSKQSLSEEADCYVVSYEEDGFVCVEVRITKPCPLREIVKRAEDVMSLRHLSRHLHQTDRSQEAVEPQELQKEQKR